MRRLVPLVFLLAGCAGSGLARDQQQALETLTYSQDGKLPMVQARVNGKGPYWFVIDSGASRSVLDAALARDLGLKTIAKGTTTGTGAGAVALDFVGSVKLSVGRFAYASNPYVIDLSGTPLSKQVRGLIGSEMFISHVVQIDPARRTLAIFDPRSGPNVRGAAQLPLTVVNGKLYLPATIEARRGLSVNRQLRIDTGSESSVNDPSASQAEVTAATQLGGGLGANFEGVSGKYHAVHLGPYALHSIWGPGGNPPAIGMELLRRFTVTFDAPRGRIYLKPNDALNATVPHPPGEVRVAGR